MLKIKNNIDLAILLDYGFKPKYDIDNGNIVKYSLEIYNKRTCQEYVEYFMHIWNNNKEITMWLNNDLEELLYDLIKADLIEKENENE